MRVPTRCGVPAGSGGSSCSSGSGGSSCSGREPDIRWHSSRAENLRRFTIRATPDPINRRDRRSPRRVAIVVASAALLVVALPTVASAHTPDGARHEVGHGETLSHVAQRFGVRVEDLAAANGLADPNVVYAGTWLAIPAGGGGQVAAPAARSHTVAAGENLSTIARGYGLSVGALTAANAIADPNLVVIGRRLVVPAAADGAPGAGPSGNWPARLRANPDRQALAPVFDLWAARYGVPADLAKAVSWLESGWQTGVVSSTGAVGIGQLMPDTVTFMRALIGDPGLDPADATHNIRMSVRYLGWLLDQTGGDAVRALAGYYQGLWALESRGMYTETFVYVVGVQQLRSRF